MRENDRLKYRIWYKVNKEYIYVSFGELCLFNVSNRKDFITEQCIGIRDKSGELIYEGDIVYCSEYNGVFTVVYDKEYCCYSLEKKVEGGKQLKALTSYLHLKIRGNINER